MFLFKSEDKFLLNNLIALFHQKNISITADLNKKYFKEVKFFKEKKQIVFEFNNSRIDLQTPTEYKIIFQKIYEILSETKVIFGNVIFNPIKQTVIYDNKKVILGSIHHIIFSHLLLHKEMGIDRFILYGLIWPNDKVIQINKLYTHLTNLKNFFSINLNYDFSFTSNIGLIKLNIN